MIFLALLSSLLLSTVGACSHNFEPWYNGICFRKDYGSTRYAQNVEFCTQSEAHLPRIMNKAQNDNFLQQIRCNIPSAKYSCSGSWLDLQCDRNHRFVWGDLSPAKYTNFREIAVCDPAAKYAVNSTDGTWFAVNTNAQLCGVCQQPAPFYNDRCRGFHFANQPLGPGGDCYIVQYKNEWEAANTQCIEDGGHFPSIPSAIENNIIQYLVTSNDTSIHIGLKTDTCGATTDNTKYMWTDGTATTYTNFALSAKCSEKRKCTAMIKSLTPLQSDDMPGDWDSVECTDTLYPSICVRPAISFLFTQPSDCPIDPVYNIGQYITSPGFPKATTVADCTYHVNVPAGKSVRLRPLSFEANRCCDSLNISDSAGNKQTWTGIHAAPSPVFSNNVTLTWNAKSGEAVVGFRILVEEVSAMTSP